MLKEFREFVLRGNVLDLAVAVVLGAAFNAIVTSLVEDILTPLIGILMGGVDFSAMSIQIGEAVVAYGKFIQAIINFLIVGMALFLVVRSINRVQRRFLTKEEVEEPAPVPPEVALLTEIRDLLKSPPQR